MMFVVADVRQSFVKRLGGRMFIDVASHFTKPLGECCHPELAKDLSALRVQILHCAALRSE